LTEISQQKTKRKYDASTTYQKAQQQIKQIVLLPFDLIYFILYSLLTKENQCHDELLLSLAFIMTTSL